MVFGVCGKLGGGKSLTCVFLMLRALERGHFVTSNIKLLDSYLENHAIDASNYTFIDDFSTIDPWTLRAGDFRGSGGKKRSMIVIDEAGEWLDSYSDARHKGQLSDVASWLRQSDKLGQDVYFIVQFENLLHNRLRSIVHRWIICQDFAKWRLPFVPFKIPLLSNFVCSSFYDSRSKDVSNRLWIWKGNWLFKAYETSAFFGDSYLSSKTAKTLDLTGKSYRNDNINARNALVFIFFLLIIQISLIILSYLAWGFGARERLFPECFADHAVSRNESGGTWGERSDRGSRNTCLVLSRGAPAPEGRGATIEGAHVNPIPHAIGGIPRTRNEGKLVNEQRKESGLNG